MTKSNIVISQITDHREITVIKINCLITVNTKSTSLWMQSTMYQKYSLNKSFY